MSGERKTQRCSRSCHCSCRLDGDNTIKVQEKGSFLFGQESTGNDIVDPSRYVFPVPGSKTHTCVQENENQGF